MRLRFPPFSPGRGPAAGAIAGVCLKACVTLAIGAVVVPPAGVVEARVRRDRAEYLDFIVRFVTPRGRVVDTGNGFVSHSEGQGYGMLFATAFDDRKTFDLLWKWTREQLQVRKDKLLAWRWIPTPYGGFVDDPNNASDGDLLVAWALLHAGRRWSVPEYVGEAEKILGDIERHLIVEKDGRLALLPGASGFSRPEGITVNLSYYVFPALADFAAHDRRPTAPWSRLIRDGVGCLREARFGPHGLPANWILLNDRVSTAPGRPAVFGYDAVRIPLYLAWFNPKDRASEPVVAFWDSAGFRRDPAAEVSLGDDKVDTQAPKPGMIILIDTVGALVRGGSWSRLAPVPVSPVAGQDYYSAALGLLSRLAWERRESRPAIFKAIGDR